MKKLVSSIDGLNAAVGRAVSWLSLLLVLIIVVDVFLRYFFNYSTPASFELEWHLFAVLFLLSAGWTLQKDKHVRVDVFYQNFSERNKALVNVIGTVFFLMPLCIVGITESLPFVISSFKINETSTDPGGLPARYIIKSVIPLGFFLLGLQGLSNLIKSLSTLINGTND